MGIADHFFALAACKLVAIWVLRSSSTAPFCLGPETGSGERPGPKEHHQVVHVALLFISHPRNYVGGFLPQSVIHTAPQMFVPTRLRLTQVCAGFCPIPPPPCVCAPGGSGPGAESGDQRRDCGPEPCLLIPPKRINNIKLTR
ncbi:hypothetical protein EDB87DRAFT_1626658 [Lactarius vividus]|nr:hypothetical protein EDB87DRAFT_1626658 [Lactarius vividus]